MKKRYILTLPIFITGYFLITETPSVYASVEEGWSAGTPNTCRNSNDFFLNFESGIDEIEIESTIPSIKFTTTGTLNWKYADIRTDKYNVYPHKGAYYDTNGNFFAWTGNTGDQGRIDFLGGGATYCSVLVSTGSGLTLDAYDSDGVLIATSGKANNNLNTRTFTRLTVEAPAGKTIAYVMIHDTGNFWLIDDLCTDANKAVMPVPGRTTGNHNNKFDIVFIPDNDYGSAANIDTWLPTFLDHINNQIDQRFGAAAPVTGNLDRFNFYYTRMQGVASNKTLPANLRLMAPFADAFVILHTAVFGDSTSMAHPSIYGAEGEISAATQNGRSFIHESGHGVFGLADEYNGCNTSYFQPNPFPNIWATEALGRADATSEGWDPNAIWKFTDCQGDWWKLGTTSYIMEDGSYFANGWGRPAERRIRWFLNQYSANEASEAMAAEAASLAEKSIWLNIQIDNGAFSLIKEGFVTDAPQDYLPGKYDFTIKVFSNGGAVLGEYGINDPRRILAESDYNGPKWLNSANFQITVPYFSSVNRVDLIESATGTVKLSIDVSKYATAKAPEAVCKNITTALDEKGKASITADDIDGGSSDPEGGSVSLSIDKSEFTCADLGENKVTLTATDEEGNPGACTAIVTVEDTTAPVISGPPNITVECDKPTDPASTGKATAQDNCDASPVIKYSDIESPGTCPNKKTIVRTWSASDSSGNTSSYTQTITVADTTPPVITFNAANTIIPPSVPISFTATALDNCAKNPTVSILDYYCYKVTDKGKEVSKMESCAVKLNGATVTVTDSGGVGTHIKLRAQAQDGCGNVSRNEHELVVINPSDSKSKGKRN